MRGLMVSAAAVFVAAVPSHAAAILTEAEWTGPLAYGATGSGSNADATGDTFYASTGVTIGSGPAASDEISDLGGDAGDSSYVFGVPESMGSQFGAQDDFVLTTSETNVGNTYTLTFDFQGNFAPVGTTATSLFWQVGGDFLTGGGAVDGAGNWLNGFVIESGGWEVFDSTGASLYATTFDIDGKDANLGDIGGGGLGFIAGITLDQATPLDGLIFGFSAEIVVTKIPAPGALAMFGLVGIMGTRRRR